MRWITLVVGLLVGAGQATFAQDAKRVSFQTPDGVEIIGSYYPATVTPVPVVVLVHDYRRNRADWTDWARLLSRNGIAALAIDLRGHGESVRQETPQGLRRPDPKALTAQDFQSLLLDVNVAVNWLEQQPDVDAKRLVVMGAGLGANLALRYQVFHEKLAGLVLLGPDLRYKAADIETAVPRLGAVPLRVVAAELDGIPYESSRRLMAWRKDAKQSSDKDEFIVCSGNAHGVELLSKVEALPKMLLDWLKQVFAPAPAPPPASPAAPAP